MKYQVVYLNVVTYVTVCLNELDSVCLNGRAGQGKPSRRYCSPQYLFVYLKVRIFKVTVLIYYDHHLIIIWLGHFYQNTIDQKSR